MDQSANFDSPAWKLYREKLKEYNDVEKLVAKSKYYLNKHVR
jgi:predicted GNAT superfamily acetyltransferase